MRQPRDQHWAELLRALEIAADGLPGGHGDLGVRVTIYDGYPSRVRIVERVIDYNKLGMANSVLRET